MAATALGLTTAQAYRYVLLPMAFRIILPPLTSEFLNTIKNTSVAITIGLIELTGQARAMQEFSFQVFEAFTAATVLYLLINIVVVIAMRFLERARGDPRLHHRGSEPPCSPISISTSSAARWRYLFLDGMTFTLTLTGLAALGGLVFGTLIALMRLSGYRLLGRIAGLYVDLMRSLPLVLVIFWFYFLVPYIGQWLTGRVAADPRRRVHLLARHLHHVRGGVFLRDHARRHPVDLEGPAGRGQALGLTYSQTMRYIVLPQAFRNMLPVLLTQTIVLFQDTSLVYVLSIPDFLGAASKVAQRDGRLVEMYLFAAAVYFIISCFASFGVRRLQARIAIVR